MTLDLDELERVARTATPGEWKQLGAKVVVEPYRTIQCFGVIRRGPDGTNASVSEDAAHIASFNPFVALELIRLARLGKWAEDVGVTSLKTITLQRMSRHVDIGLLANFTLRVAQEALDYLPKYTAEFVDDGKEGT